MSAQTVLDNAVDCPQCGGTGSDRSKEIAGSIVYLDCWMCSGTGLKHPGPCCPTCIDDDPPTALTKANCCCRQGGFLDSIFKLPED